ncbi:MAG: hypothetical protein V9H25_21435 [Candidatus Competibacter sp.]|jgi:hypothetical protein
MPIWAAEIDGAVKAADPSAAIRLLSREIEGAFRMGLIWPDRGF